MTDGVNRPPNISSRFTGLDSRLRQSGDIEQQKQEKLNKDSYDAARGRSATMQDSSGEELSLSLPIVRALLAHDLPSEVQLALSEFAPLGDLVKAEDLCDRIERKGQDHVIWSSKLTLRQALENAAS